MFLKINTLTAFLVALFCFQSIAQTAGCPENVVVQPNHATQHNCPGGSISIQFDNASEANLQIFVKDGQGIVVQNFVTSSSTFSETVSGLYAGMYVVDVFGDDPQNPMCYHENFMLNQPACSASIVATATPTSLHNCSDGTITLNAADFCQAAQAYFFRQVPGQNNQMVGQVTIANGQQFTLSNLRAGDYMVEVHENGPFGCTVFSNIVVDQPDCTISTTATAASPTCPNVADGSVELSLAGTCEGATAFLYLDGEVVRTGNIPSGQSSIMGDLAAGEYTYTVVESGPSGCTQLGGFTIDQPTCSLNVDFLKNDVSLRYCSNGSIQINPSNFCGSWSASLTFNINGYNLSMQTMSGDSSATFEDLFPGSFTVEVHETNNANCSQSATFVVEEPSCDQVHIISTILKQPTLGCQDGKVRIEVEGACFRPGLVIYNENNTAIQGFFFGSSYEFYGLATGRYHVVFPPSPSAQDSLCFATDTFYLESPCGLAISTVSAAPTKVGCLGKIRTTVSGLGCNANASIIAYSSLGQETVLTRTATRTYSANLLPDTYTVVATYGNCIASNTVTIIAPPCNLRLTPRVVAQYTTCNSGIVEVRTQACGQVYYQLFHADNTFIASQVAGEVVFFDSLAVGSYLVKAFAGSCMQEKAFRVVTACPAPTDLTAVEVSTNTAQITWSEVPCATGYRIQYRIQGQTNWKTLTFAAGTTSATLLNLVQNTNYEVRVRSICTPTISSPQSPSITFFTGGGLRQSQDRDFQKVLSMGASAEVYPNPTESNVQVKWENEGESVEVVVFDQFGRQIMQQSGKASIGEFNGSFDVSNLQPGIYQIMLRNEIGQHSVGTFTKI